MRRHLALLALVVLALASAACDPHDPPPPPKFAIHVVNGAAGVAPHFENQLGQAVQLHGVNRPGTEYRCVQNIPYGFFTDDDDQRGQSLAYLPALVDAVASWPGVNAVRIPVNEDCWLGINGAGGPDGRYAGDAYQRAVLEEAVRFAAKGIYPILDLHWSAQGSTLATRQDVAPNLDHSLEFWRQVAERTKLGPSIILDVFNEPHLWFENEGSYGANAAKSWACYRDGCDYTYTAADSVGTPGQHLAVAGTQAIVNTIRATGNTNVILVAGLGYANAFDNWMNYRPVDPAGQLAASVHTYPNSGMNVNSIPYLDGTLAVGGLSSSVPIVLGEFGDWPCNGHDPTPFVQGTMDWANSHGYSWLAWGWDQGEGCNGPSLVTSNTLGTTNAYGQLVKAELARRAEAERGQRVLGAWLSRGR